MSGVDRETQVPGAPGVGAAPHHWACSEPGRRRLFPHPPAQPAVLPGPEASALAALGRRARGWHGAGLEEVRGCLPSRAPGPQSGPCVPLGQHLLTFHPHALLQPPHPSLGAPAPGDPETPKHTCREVYSPHTETSRDTCHWKKELSPSPHPRL